jgi:hypothetical protein
MGVTFAEFEFLGEKFDFAGQEIEFPDRMNEFADGEIEFPGEKIDFASQEIEFPGRMNDFADRKIEFADQIAGSAVRRSRLVIDGSGVRGKPFRSPALRATARGRLRRPAVHIGTR